MSKKRIALVVNSLSNGGAERVASGISKVLSSVYEIDIIVNNARVDYSYEGKLIPMRIPNVSGFMAGIVDKVMIPNKILFLRKLKKQKHYEAVISFSERTNLVNVISGSRTSKAIVSIHNSAEREKNTGMILRTYRKLQRQYYFPRADKIVSCSKEIRDELLREYKMPEDRVCVIYNGIDVEEVRRLSAKPPEKAEKKKDDGDYLIVTIGRLKKQKGQWHLIRVVKYLRDQGMNVRLLILGEGEQQKRLEELVAQCGLTDAVMMPGFVRNPFSYLARADAAVFPSLYEGFSLAILEALACGVPCISTDHRTGAREILAPETDYGTKVTDRIEITPYGVLVPVCDGAFRKPEDALTPEERIMADAIRRVLTDDKMAERLRVSSIKRAEDFSLASTGQQWLELINGTSTEQTVES